MEKRDERIMRGVIRTTRGVVIRSATVQRAVHRDELANVRRRTEQRNEEQREQNQGVKFHGGLSDVTRKR